MASSTPAANEPAKELILVHTVQLKPMIKTQISGRMASSSIRDVAFATVHSERTHLLDDDKDNISNKKYLLVN